MSSVGALGLELHCFQLEFVLPILEELVNSIAFVYELEMDDKNVVESEASQPVKFHEVHEPCSQRLLAGGCNMLSPRLIQHFWPGVGNKGSNCEHRHEPRPTSSLVFIYTSYPLHVLDKSLSSFINFDDFVDSPYIAGTIYTNNDNITILDGPSSPCAGKTRDTLSPLELFASLFGFHRYRKLDEV